MTDPYALGLSADKLWSPEELGAARIVSRGQTYALKGEDTYRPHVNAQSVDLGLVRGSRIAMSLGALCILLLTIYALSPGGIESALNTLAIAALPLVAVFAFRVWDELRLLWSQNRE